MIKSFLFLNEMNSSNITNTNITINNTSFHGDEENPPFISTEFFYNLLPCYIFLVTSIYRIFSIYKEPFFKEKFMALHQSNFQPTQPTPGFEETTRDSKPKIIVSNLEADLDQMEEKTASYYIKTRLSFANSVLYIIAIIFSFSLPPSLFAAAVSPLEGLWYLFGVLAWYISGKLVKMEFDRGLNQEIYTHRFFWVFAGSLALIRIFQRSEVKIYLFKSLIFHRDLWLTL